MDTIVTLKEDITATLNDYTPFQVFFYTALLFFIFGVILTSLFGAKFILGLAFLYAIYVFFFKDKKGK